MKVTRPADFKAQPVNASAEMQLARLGYHKCCGFPVSGSKRPPFTCGPLTPQARPRKQECKTPGDRAAGWQQVTPTIRRGLQDPGEMLTETQKSWKHLVTEHRKEPERSGLCLLQAGDPPRVPTPKPTGSHSHLPNKRLEERWLSSPEENVKQRTSPGQPSTEPSSDGDGLRSAWPTVAERLMCHRCD